MDFENSTNKQVAKQLGEYLYHDETEKFKKLLEEVGDFIRSSQKTGLFSKNKNKNKLNYLTIFTEDIDVDSIQYVGRSDAHHYTRLVSYAVECGNIEIVKELLNNYSNYNKVNMLDQPSTDGSPSGRRCNSLLTIAIVYKARIIDKIDKQLFMELLTFLVSKGSKLGGAPLIHQYYLH